MLKGLLRAIAAFVAACVFAAPAIAQDQPAKPRIPVMIVGVAHFAGSKMDLHSTAFGDLNTPQAQAQIQGLVRRLLAFRPTKVLIEVPFGNTTFPERYRQYLAGNFTLGPNEVYQLDFRIAAQSHLATVYPVDALDFPFDYPSVQKSAKAHDQQSTLDAAEAALAPEIAQAVKMGHAGDIFKELQYVNTPEALYENASWYSFIDRVGDGTDTAGADLVSYWWARNLHIFANITHTITSPNDRILVIFGAGHKPLLDQFVKLSPDLELVDPEQYLNAP